MEGLGESVPATGATAQPEAQTQTCPRCGTFAVLRPQLGRALCDPCWLRLIEPGVSTSQVLGDVRKLAAPLLLRSWLLLVVINLPLTVGGALYRLRTGEALGLQLNSLYHVVTLLAVGAIYGVSHQLLVGDRRPDWSAAWRSSVRNYGPMLGATVLSGLITVFFTLLLVIPGLLRVFWYFISTPIALHENWSASEALAQSKARTQGHRANILASTLAILAIGFVPTLFAVGAFGVLVGVASRGAPLSIAAHVLIDVASRTAVQAPFVLVYFATASIYVRCSVQHASEPAL